jgi:hypothetical protein
MVLLALRKACLPSDFYFLISPGPVGPTKLLWGWDKLCGVGYEGQCYGERSRHPKGLKQGD